MLLFFFNSITGKSLMCQNIKNVSMTFHVDQMNFGHSVPFQKGYSHLSLTQILITLFETIRYLPKRNTIDSILILTENSWKTWRSSLRISEQQIFEESKNQYGFTSESLQMKPDISEQKTLPLAVLSPNQHTGDLLRVFVRSLTH